MVGIEKYKERLKDQEDYLAKVLEKYQNSLSKLYHAERFMSSYYKEEMQDLNKYFFDMLVISSEIDTLQYTIRDMESEDEDDFLMPF